MLRNEHFMFKFFMQILRLTWLFALSMMVLICLEIVVIVIIIVRLFFALRTAVSIVSS